MEKHRRKHRKTFISATRNPVGIATMSEAIERQSHLAAADKYWHEGLQIVESEPLYDEDSTVRIREGQSRNGIGDIR